MSTRERGTRTWARISGRIRLELHPYVAWGVARIFSTPVSWPPDAAPPPVFHAREVLPHELAAVARAFERMPGEFELRASKGDRCVCTFAGETPVHMRWFSTSPTLIPELGVYACPGDGEVYTYDSHTAPAWRRKGAMTLERTIMYQLLCSEGYRLAWNYILSDNRPSLATLRQESRLELSVPFLRLGRGRPLLGVSLAHPLYPPEALPPARRSSAESGGEATKARAASTTP